MKKICSCLLILTYFTSCDDIDTNVIDTPDTISAGTVSHSSPMFRGITEMPANSDNPFDNVGRIYDTVLTECYASGSNPTGINAVAAKVSFIANNCSGFNGIKGATYHDVLQERVSYILEHPMTCIADIVNASGLSATGKSTLILYINAILIANAKETEFKPIYDYTCDFETGVLGNTSLTTKDKRVILIVTSIARYSIYKAKKRPKKNTDPDWTILIANLTGAAYGADCDMAEAVTTAIVCGITQNQ